MPMRRLLPILAFSLHAEIFDRTAAVVNRMAVTASAIEEQVRVAAFLNQEPVDLSPANRRRAAERLVEQLLLQHEMQVSRYVPPTEAEVENLFSQVNRPADLRRYSLSEAALRRSLLLQLATLRFIELRFRPGSAVSDGEIEIYYRDRYVPDWSKSNPGKTPPEIDDARDAIEQILLQRKVDQALDQWLKEARSQSRIQFFDEAFQ